MTILSSSRGEGAALRFGSVLAHCYGEAVTIEADEMPVPVESGEAEQNFMQYFGSMPPSPHVA